MFISFEGLDGSGKTTQVRRLIAALEARSHRVVAVREPGGTALGESIRSLLLAPDGDITPRAELLLFSAARAQLVEHVIRPALASGAVVVADRFYDSTTAYQGFGRGLLSLDDLDRFHEVVTGGLAPTLTLVIDVPPEVAKQRRSAQSADRIEAADDAFFERARNGYHQLAVRDPKRVAVVDGAAAPSDVARRVQACIADRVPMLLERR